MRPVAMPIAAPAVCLLMSLASPVSVRALDVSGTVSTSTTWSDTVRLTGDVTVANGVTLTVAPRTVVVAQGKYRITVAGRILATGAAGDTIRFGAVSTATGWFGLRFPGTAATNDSSLFEYCELADGRADGSGADGTGGVMLIDGFAKVRVSHCVVRGNNAHFGGALYLASQAHITVSDCLFHDNQASGTTQTDGIGGAIYASNASPRLVNNVFRSNGAITGGAICLRTSAALVQGNEITGNRATGIMSQNYHGGGVYVQQSTARIEGNTIANNMAQRDGGGVYLITSPQAVVSRNIICNNGGRDGGGIFCQDGAATMVSNLLANNTAGTNGGGICLRNASSLILNATIVNNLAENGGGVAAIGGSTAVLRNCILWGNSAFWDGNQGLASGSAPGLSFCDIQGGPSGFATTGTWSDNLQVSPQFTAPSAGTGTQSDGLNANWSLATGSPCMNAGSTDTSGVGRLDAAGAARISGGRVDMGALEAGTVAVARPAAVRAAAARVVPQRSADLLGRLVVASPQAAGVYLRPGALSVTGDSRLSGR